MLRSPNRNASRVARIFYVSRFVAIRLFGGLTTDEIVRPPSGRLGAAGNAIGGGVIRFLVFLVSMQGSQGFVLWFSGLFTGHIAGKPCVGTA